MYNNETVIHNMYILSMYSFKNIMQHNCSHQMNLECVLDILYQLVSQWIFL